MRQVFGGSIAGARKIDGHEMQTAGIPDRNARRPVIHPQVTHINGDRISFRDLALFAWPYKADAHLAHLTGADPRTCRRWLAGDNEPPADVLAIILGEIMRRYHQRGD